jgi:polysaccharide pyruvyl transferase WcaK-like protein
VIAFSPGIDPRWTPTPSRSADILDHIQSKTGGSILFIPFFPGRDDGYIRQVLGVRQLKGLVLNSPVSWQDAFGCFRMADFSVPMRLHAMIASALAEIPTLPIPYYPKVPMIATDLGLTNMIAHDDTDWKTKCDRFLAGAELQKAVLRASVARMRERSLMSKAVLERFISEIA